MFRCFWSVILWLNISFSILVQISVFPSMFAPERASFDNKLIRNSNTHLRVHKYTQNHNLARKEIHYISLHYISHFFSMETDWLKSSPIDNFNLIESWCHSIVGQVHIWIWIFGRNFQSFEQSELHSHCMYQCYPVFVYSKPKRPEYNG